MTTVGHREGLCEEARKRHVTFSMNRPRTYITRSNAHARGRNEDGVETKTFVHVKEKQGLITAVIGQSNLVIFAF